MLFEIVLTVGLVVCIVLAVLFFVLRPYLFQAAREVKEDYQRQVIRDEVAAAMKEHRTTAETAAAEEVNAFVRGPAPEADGEEQVNEGRV